VKDVSRLFKELVEIIAKLRSEDGCPWDRQQTHDTLKPQLIEEAYEVIDAIDEKSDEKLGEELGDLLMQVLLNAQIAKDDGRFDICGVIEKISEKLKRRHPHVFGSVRVSDAQEVLRNWEIIKSRERGNKDRKSLMDGIPLHLPNLMKAHKMQARASRVGFDWEKAEDVLQKVEEEIQELKTSMERCKQRDIEEELGDILFSVVNLSKFLNVEPEEALRKSNAKFVRRFKQLEAEIAARGDNIDDYDLADLDKIWDSVKENESGNEGKA
jgi:tetrapyrrole methylase family protein/MazG family protein